MIGGGPQKITVEIGGKIAASLGRSIKAAQIQVSSFGRNVTRTMNDAAIAGKKGFKGIFDNALWQQATVGATAFAGAIGLSVRAAMEFDKSMADVRKAIDFKDGEMGLKKFGRELVKLSTEVPYTAAELSKIAAAAGFAGYAEKDIIPFTKAAARMGIAFQMTAEQAGDAMVAMRASMGLTQPQVEQLGDAINYLSDKFEGTVNAADLVEVTKRIGAIGKAAGLTSEQVAGLGAAFLASGTPTEVAATGLKNFLNALTKGDQATKNQREALQAMFGKDNSQQLAKGMQTNAEGTIKSVLAAMAKLPKEQQVSMAGALFGEESKAAIMPLLTNTKLIGQAFDLIRGKQAFAGSMQKEFNNQMATSGAQAKIFQSGLQAVGITVGSALLPSLNSILKTVTPLLVKFADWAGKNEGLVTTITLVGGALAGLVIALPIIAGVVSAIGTIGAPAIAIGLAIIGIGAAFVALYNQVGWFRNAVNSTWQVMGTVFKALITYWSGVWNVFIGILNGDTKKIGQGFAQIGEGIKATLGALLPWMGKIVIQLGQQWLKLAPTIIGLILNLPGTIIGMFARSKIGQRIISTIIDGLKAKAAGLFGWVTGAWAKIKDLVGGGEAPAPAGGTPPGRAVGGRVRAGMPYVVGERRRELFVPGMDGAIIPRIARPAAGGGGVTINAPVTINAAGGDGQGIREQVRLAFEDLISRAYGDYRVALND